MGKRKKIGIKKFYEIKHLHEQGKTVSEIASLMKLSPITVKACLKRMIRNRYDSGDSYEERHKLECLSIIRVLEEEQ